jgi:diacylglycerol kinase family enzyme
VVLNADSGGVSPDSGRVVAAIRERLAGHGIEAQVTLTHGAEIRRALCDALATPAEAFWVGGGDGTARAAAAVMVNDRRPLGVLPLGTLNHFAKDLGVPMNLMQAIEALVRGTVRQVDVGDLNGHIFLNTSSLGLYPEIVTSREEQRQKSGRSKWRALASASWLALRELKHLDVSISTDNGELTRSTPFVFVGNNEYELEYPALGARRSIDAGVLCLYVGSHLSRIDLAALALRAVSGRLHGDQRVDVFKTQKVLVHPHHGDRVHVSLDGEILRLNAPLVYRVRQRALRVVAPAA